MEYNEYIEQKKYGAVVLGIDEPEAKKFLQYLPKKMKYKHMFWSWAWLPMIPISIINIFYVAFWAGAVSILAGAVLFYISNKLSDAEPVLKYADQNEKFFTILTQKNLISVKTRDG